MSTQLSFRIGGTAGAEGWGERCSTMRNPPPTERSSHIVRGFLAALRRAPSE